VDFFKFADPFDYMERAGFMTYTAANHDVLASVFRMCESILLAMFLASGLPI